MPKATNGWLLCQQLTFSYSTELENKTRMQMNCPGGHTADYLMTHKEVEKIQQFTKNHLKSEHVSLNENTIKAHLVSLVINNPPVETSPSTTYVVSLTHHPKALPGSFEEDNQFFKSN